MARFADSILWESIPKAEMFRETYANQLSVLLRVYEYAAFTANRYARQRVGHQRHRPGRADLLILRDAGSWVG